MPNSRKANVLVVDAVARFGLVQLIGSHALLRVAGETDSLAAAREMASRLKPEIVVLDPALGDGVHFIEDLVRSKARPHVVAFTALEDALSVQRAFQAGVCGYVTRRDPLPAIVGAVKGERQVFRLLGAGRSGSAIASELGVSVKTVETHRQRIKEKLRLKTGAELNHRAVLAANGSSH